MAKVLVIDDDATMRGVIGRILAQRGYEAVEAANGSDGMDALIQTNFAFVILDILMPVQDGIETIQRIRELNAKIPVIAISVVPALLDDAKALGADSTLKKPFTAVQLMGAIADLLDRGQA